MYIHMYLHIKCCIYRCSGLTEQTLASHLYNIKKGEMYIATVNPGTSLYISPKSPLKETVQEVLVASFSPFVADVISLSWNLSSSVLLYSLLIQT